MNGEGLEPDDSSERVRAEERHRLARYLHDRIGQTLILAKLQLARIQHALQEPFGPAKQTWLDPTIESLIRELDAAMQAVQEEAFLLNPPGLTEVGLAATLEEECVAFSHRTGIPCKGAFEPLDMDAERGALVVLIVREALANIARHSRATTAEVTLQRSGEQGILSVRDNGTGFDPIRITAAKSFGIRGMKDRARVLRGELNFTSRRSEGCHITLSFPLDLRAENSSSPR
jgi:signal transduction histidine kinase